MQFDISEATAAVQAMINGFVERLPYLLVALVVFFIFFLASKGVRAGVRAVAQRESRHYNLGIVLGRLSSGLIIFIGLLIALVIAIPGFTPGQLVSILGLSSVAIGFAFRDILQNFLAGILLLLSEPFRIGDQIKLGEFEGTVKDIQTRATFITTYDGRRIVIPNANLFTNSLVVNTANDKRRLEYDVGIGYADDIARSKRIMLDTVRSIPEVLDEPAPDALVVALAESTINIRLRWWIQPPRQYDVLHAQDVVLEKVKNALVAEGVDLAFPTRVVLFHDQTEATDGDRGKQREGWPAGKEEVPRPMRIVDALQMLQKKQGDGEAEQRESSGTERHEEKV